MRRLTKRCRHEQQVEDSNCRSQEVRKVWHCQLLGRSCELWFQNNKQDVYIPITLQNTHVFLCFCFCFCLPHIRTASIHDNGSSNTTCNNAENFRVCNLCSPNRNAGVPFAIVTYHEPPTSSFTRRASATTSGIVIVASARIGRDQACLQLRSSSS